MFKRVKNRKQILNKLRTGSFETELDILVHLIDRDRFRAVPMFTVRIINNIFRLGRYWKILCSPESSAEKSIIQECRYREKMILLRQ